MHKIDFVIPWVDGSDPDWLKEKNAFSPEPSCDDREIRYRDWGMLKFWFRAVEENAPWVNKIFFITWGHVPDWLNTDHEKIRIVRHKDYIPAEYLPTFSSHVIELNLHRIPDLSEHFVYFNDDVFLLDKVAPKDFFVGGLPCDWLIENPITPLFGGFSPVLCEMGCVINKHFSKKDLRKLGWKKLFNPVYKTLVFRTLAMMQFSNIMGFYNSHITQPHLKSTFEEVWEEEYDELNKTCLNRFRGLNDVNQYICRYWNLCKGNFHPVYPLGRNIKMSKNMDFVTDVIRKRKYKVVTINDEDGIEDLEVRQEKVYCALEKRYPCKCSFER